MCRPSRNSTVNLSVIEGHPTLTGLLFSPAYRCTVLKLRCKKCSMGKIWKHNQPTYTTLHAFDRNVIVSL